MTSLRQRAAAVAVAGAALAMAGCTDDSSITAPEPSNAATADADTADESSAPATTATSTAPTPAPTTSLVAPSTVGSSTAPATSSPATAAPSTGLAGDAFDGIGPLVDAFVEERGLNGVGLVVVDRDSGIVHEEYWGEFDADRVSFIASSSKMITAGVLARLDEDDVLDLDVPIADQVDWTGNPTITPAQLVSNSSGLVGLLPDPTYAPYICQFIATVELAECGATIFETPDDDSDIVPPDTEFRYGGGQWQVVGALAELTSGLSWSDLIDSIYVQPCGVDSLGYANQWSLGFGFDYPEGVDPTSLAPTDNPNMEGGAFITARDYGELLLMHLRGGLCDDGRSLSAESVERLHADRTLTAYPDGASVSGYGMGWWVDRRTGRLSDPGAYGAVGWIDIDAGYGAYSVVEADAVTGSELSNLIAAEIDAAMAR